MNMIAAEAVERQPRQPRFLRLFSILLAYVLAVGTLQSLIIWHPRIDEPRDVDAVIVLGVPKERLATGLDLVKAGYSNLLVVSSPPPDTSPARVPPICGGVAAGFEVHCFTPEPFSTKGEALYVARLVQEHGWDEIIVVTYRSHISRSRYYFERCVPDAKILFVANEREHTFLRWANRMLYETGGWLKAAAGDVCG